MFLKSVLVVFLPSFLTAWNSVWIIVGAQIVTESVDCGFCGQGHVGLKPSHLSSFRTEKQNVKSRGLQTGSNVFGSLIPSSLLRTETSGSQSQSLVSAQPFPKPERSFKEMPVARTCPGQG